jgi:hypothetical protein
LAWIGNDILVHGHSGGEVYRYLGAIVTLVYERDPVEAAERFREGVSVV